MNLKLNTKITFLELITANSSGKIIIIITVLYSTVDSSETDRGAPGSGWILDSAQTEWNHEINDNWNFQPLCFASTCPGCCWWRIPPSKNAKTAHDQSAKWTKEKRDAVWDSWAANHLQLWVSFASCAETVIFLTGAGGASHLHIKPPIKRESWRWSEGFVPSLHTSIRTICFLFPSEASPESSTGFKFSLP